MMNRAKSVNDGDWICADKSCANINFSWRTKCNKCGKEKSKVEVFKKTGSEIGKKAAEKSGGLFSADDWHCSSCGNVNWARRMDCNVCNAPKFGTVEPRTGLGGGYNEREDVEYNEREESDDEFDEFGRRKKKFRVKSNEAGSKTEVATTVLHDEEEDSGEDFDLSKYDLAEDDDDNEDTSKYDLGGDSPDRKTLSMSQPKGRTTKASSRKSRSSRSRSHSPVRRRSRSPVRKRSRSPVRKRSRSPVRRRSRSRSHDLKRRGKFSRSRSRGRSRSPIKKRKSRSSRSNSRFRDGDERKSRSRSRSRSRDKRSRRSRSVSRDRKDRRTYRRSYSRSRSRSRERRRGHRSRSRERYR